MCKSASSVFCWYAETLVQRTFGSDGYFALRKLTESGELSGKGRYIDEPITDAKIDRLLELVAKHGPTVVKVHCFLQPHLRERIESGEILSTFCYRDPRDMILSAMNHRVRALADGEHVFEHFTTVEESLEHAKFWCWLALNWVKSGLVPLFQYEEIVGDPEMQICRLADYLGLSVNQQKIDELIETERSRRKTGWNEFNGAHRSRFESEMTESQIETCERKLGWWIERLGFKVSHSYEIPERANAA